MRALLLEYYDIIPIYAYQWALGGFPKLLFPQQKYQT